MCRVEGFWIQGLGVRVGQGQGFIQGSGLKAHMSALRAESTHSWEGSATVVYTVVWRNSVV